MVDPKSTNRIIAILSTILVGLFIILIVYVITVPQGKEDLGESALLNNSLINRFFNRSSASDNPDIPNILKKVESSGTFSLTLARGGSQIYYYTRSNGEIRSITIGKDAPSTLIATINPNANQITWAPDTKSLYAYYIDGIIYYNLDTNESHNLSNNIKEVTFSKDSDLVSYIYVNEENNSSNISIADPLISSFRNVINTRRINWSMYWIDNNRIALHNITNSDVQQSLLILDTRDDSLSPLLDYKNKLSTRWSPDRSGLLYSYLHPRTQKIQLYYRHIPTGSEKQLIINTLASKCDWDTDNVTIYCAVPQTTLTQKTLNELSKDRIVKINTLNPNSIITILDKSDFDVTEINFSRLYNLLFFIDQHSGSIYQLPVD